MPGQTIDASTFTAIMQVLQIIFYITVSGAILTVGLMRTFKKQISPSNNRPSSEVHIMLAEHVVESRTFDQQHSNIHAELTKTTNEMVFSLQGSSLVLAEITKTQEQILSVSYEVRNRYSKIPEKLKSINEAIKAINEKEPKK